MMKVAIVCNDYIKSNSFKHELNSSKTCFCTGVHDKYVCDPHPPPATHIFFVSLHHSFLEKNTRFSASSSQSPHLTPLMCSLHTLTLSISVYPPLPFLFPPVFFFLSPSALDESVLPSSLSMISPPLLLFLSRLFHSKLHCDNRLLPPKPVGSVKIIQHLLASYFAAEQLTENMKHSKVACVLCLCETCEKSSNCIF